MTTRPAPLSFVSPPLIGVADDTGAASVTFTTPVGLGWTVTRIAVSSTSAYPTDARVFVNGIFQCGTGAGNGDSATGNPMTVAEGSEVIIEWTGCSPGAQCTGVLTYLFTQ
jgi:hypothetical protein